MINVIWVDDLILNQDGTQTDLCKSIVNSAYDEGIDITPCTALEKVEWFFTISLRLIE